MLDFFNMAACVLLDSVPMPSLPLCSLNLLQIGEVKTWSFSQLSYDQDRAEFSSVPILVIPAWSTNPTIRLANYGLRNNGIVYLLLP